MVSVKQTVVTELGRGDFHRFPEDHNVVSVLENALLSIICCVYVWH